ncbi:MAG: type I DNA topoisomerase [Candidatus Omnitrophica bacterium]|nr:type I DNA topoisomerase [Candidatus Omnitrophota bacterium]MBU4479504.1 type I DNA topoisomerase [Candidatus Omnitrophota bacterium]MCG2702987.1 type I DNA topoisomerase [Candidatus Omnitrophota bacterium]
MKKLVIVESPTKAKTISKILGSDFVVYSSMGHIIDLPQRKLGVDVDRDFQPTYVVIPGKKKTLTQLKKEVKNISHVYLATDHDREGEAISWHLREHLKGAGKEHEFLRVIFHEITPDAIKEAFANPVVLDLNKVNAQQARRVLDRIVGYFLSPLLWKKVAKGLSAGRVQSVALKLIVQRERLIQSFVSQEYWKIEARLQRKQGGHEIFTAELVKYDGEKIELANQDTVQNLLAELKTREYSVASITKKEKKRNPYAPFITSTLQQDAFNKLKFTTRKTMLIAQQLYEGVELGAEGPIGLITYMRTDSVKIAATALEQIRKLIGERYGRDYVPAKPNVYKSKKSAQEAHEAIRPTSVSRTPEQIKEYLTPEQNALYELIWKRAVASQMKAAVYLSSTVEIAAGRYMFSAGGSMPLFDGFLKAYVEQAEEKESRLPELNKDEPLDLLELVPSQHFTRPPARYSEASLVKDLEEKGIGRPSTYAPIVYTLILRDYVRREKGYLICTELGMKVSDILAEYFPNIINVAFTATMEEELDKVEDGTLDWIAVLKDFYTPFEKKLHFAQENLKKEVIETDQVCEKCGRPMVIKWSRRGKFLSCSGFPECRNAKSMSTGVKCPNPGCEGELVMRRSKRGMRFYGCSKYPQCRYVSRDLPRETNKLEGENKEVDGGEERQIF